MHCEDTRTASSLLALHATLGILSVKVCASHMTQSSWLGLRLGKITYLVLVRPDASIPRVDGPPLLVSCPSLNKGVINSNLSSITENVNDDSLEMNSEATVAASSRLVALIVVSCMLEARMLKRVEKHCVK